MIIWKCMLSAYSEWNDDMTIIVFSWLASCGNFHCHGWSSKPNVKGMVLLQAFEAWNPMLCLECSTINILPLVEGVMVDYHTKKKYHTRKNITRDVVEGDIILSVIFFLSVVIYITPSTKGSMFFIILNALNSYDF